MYRGQEPQKKKRKRGKVAEFLLNAISGRHLLLSWRRWVGWLIVATIVAIIVIFNERVIDEKRERIRELEDKQRTNMLQLKDVNDIGIVQLTHRDVVRHELVQAIVRAYEKHAQKAERRPRVFRT